jgi:integrase
MSVRKRILPSGGTAWQVDYRDSAGVRRARQFSTKREADAFNLRARSELAAGTHTPDNASITVREAGDLWIARCERDKLEAGTLLDYRQHLKLHILPFLASNKLSRLTVPMVNAFRDQLLDAGRSPDMTRRVLKSLAALVGEAQNRGLVATNVVRDITHRRNKRTETRPIMPTQGELQAIVAATPAPRRPLVLTALLTGLRSSELRGLQWGDIDFQRDMLSVRRRADRYNKLGPPKSDAGTRDVPMSPMLINTLRSWRLVCPKGDLDLVFPNGAGNIESHANLLHRVFWPIQLEAGVVVMKEHTDEAGAPIKVPDAKYSLHALRHACAALWIAQGFNPKRIQTLMGHASIAVTLDRYGYLFEAHDTGAADMAAIAQRLVG